MSSDAIWSKRRDIPLAVLGWLAVIIIVFWLLGQINHALLILVIAGFLAFAVFPMVRILQRFVPKFLAVFIVYVVVFAGLGGLVYFIVRTAIDQFLTLSHNINYVVSAKEQGLSPLMVTLQHFGISEQQIENIGAELTIQAEHLTSSILPLLSSIFGIIIDVLLVAVLSIYLLVDGERIISWLKSNTPVMHQKRRAFLFTTLEQVVGGYIRGQLTLATIIGVLIGVGMLFFQVPYAVLLGVLAFILVFIPILGTFVSAIICIGFAFTNGWLVAVLVAGYFIIIHVIESDLLGPRIVGRAVGLHPLVSIIALIAGSELYGVTGALFASPVAGVLQAIIVTLWSEWKASHPDAFEKV